MTNFNVKTEYKAILEEYTTIDIEEDNDRMYAIKKSITESLSPVERKILIVYLELRTYSAVADYYKVSPPTIRNYINRIREKIKRYVESDTDSSDSDTDTL